MKNRQQRSSSPSRNEFLPLTNRDINNNDFVFSQQHIYILTAVVCFIIFYLFIRMILSSSSVGIASFKPEYCYEIIGYSSETYFIQSRCWSDLVKKKIENTNLQANFNYWAPTSKSEFDKRLKELKKKYPEMRRHWGSPIIFEGCSNEDKIYIGGFNEFVSLIQQRYNVYANNAECLTFG